MKVIVVVIECLEYSFLEECNTPNIDELRPHPAVSYGCTTRAAVPAILGGFLPECIYKCDYHTFKWQNPFFLTDLKRKTNLLLYINNGWAFELLANFMPEWLRKKNLDWHDRHADLPTKEMIDDFLSRSLDSYFAYFHVMETHPPFYTPSGSHDRKEAVEWVDTQIGRLVELDYDCLVVCSDHALEHDVAGSAGLKSFIAADVRNDSIRYLWR